MKHLLLPEKKLFLFFSQMIELLRKSFLSRFIYYIVNVFSCHKERKQTFTIYLLFFSAEKGENIKGLNQ